MGGIKAPIDYTIESYTGYDQLALVLIPGGLAWETNDFPDIAKFLKGIKERNITLAAICGSAFFLCKHGFLNQIKHTGDSLEFFKSAAGYTGENLYIETQVVVDQGIITAKETGTIEFTYEIFKLLSIDTPEELEIWYNRFKHNDNE